VARRAGIAVFVLYLILTYPIALAVYWIGMANITPESAAYSLILALGLVVVFVTVPTVVGGWALSARLRQRSSKGVLRTLVAVVLFTLIWIVAGEFVRDQFQSVSFLPTAEQLLVMGVGWLVGLLAGGLPSLVSSASHGQAEAHPEAVAAS
jgi:hypothetical protein